MALSRLSFGGSRSLGQVCARALATGPQPPDPKSVYYGRWSVSERVIQLPHIKFLKTGWARRPKRALEKEKFNMRTVPRNRFLVNQRLMEMDQAGEKISDITQSDADEAESSVAEDHEGENESAGLPGLSLFNRNHRTVAPHEVDKKMHAMVKQYYTAEDGDVDGDWTSIELTDLLKKFHLLAHCGKEFDAIMSNSRLTEMKTVGDVLAHYQREPEKMVYYKNLNLEELPENVKFQIKREYVLRKGDLANQDEYRKRKASWATVKLAEGAHA
eukprot:scpid83303/ scgid12981/ 39S ribosomal protein L50, mitochondrial